MVLLSREVDAFCAAHQYTSGALEEAWQRLHGNQQIRTISELVLFIGNFVNFHQFRMSNATGFRWDALLSMAQSYACGSENSYSLLMFLVENVHRNHPSLARWVDVFDGLDELTAGLELGKGQDYLQRWPSINQELRMFRRRLEALARMGGAVYEEAASKLQRFEEQFQAAATQMSALPAYFGFLDKC